MTACSNTQGTCKCKNSDPHLDVSAWLDEFGGGHEDVFPYN